jgi:hypothetical protein
VENELNAANRLNNKKSIGRENGPFDANSRCGSLWSNADGTGLGADVDTVFYNIVDAIRDGRTLAGAHDTQLMHQFEGFEETEHKIIDWVDDLDIVGINVFVNTPISDHHPGTGINEPMGFMTGEYVYAVKRLLNGIGRGHVPVWMTSTTYPVFEACSNDYLGFTYDRQALYVEQCIDSLKAYGADGFVYNYFIIDESELEDKCESLYNATGSTLISGAQSVTYTDTYWLIQRTFDLGRSIRRDEAACEVSIW